MGDVNVQLVREFFELNRFQVLTYYPRETTGRGHTDHIFQLFVENTRPASGENAGFVLEEDDLPGIARAAVEVRAWHADRFYASVIESSRVLSEFIEEKSLAVAENVFGDQPFATILVLSELPASPEPRERSIQLLRDTGTTHVIEFPTILQGLLEKISAAGTYPASDTLQTLRLLKRYGLIRDQQMEFAFPIEAPPTSPGTPVETADASEQADDDE